MNDAVVVHVLPANGLPCGFFENDPHATCGDVAESVMVVIGAGFSATPLCDSHYPVVVDTVAHMITVASGRKAA